MSTRKPIEFDLFTDRHLLDLAQQVAAEIRRRRDATRQLVKERGGLVEGEGSPRYRNPWNASQTWSGRGRQPSWVLDARAVGLTLEDLTRDDDRPIRGKRRRR